MNNRKSIALPKMANQVQGKNSTAQELKDLDSEMSIYEKEDEQQQAQQEMDFYQYIQKSNAKWNKQGDNNNASSNDKDVKHQNTIIQQINGFSRMAMSERIAKKTIEDHKYLLELVDNRAAIAYFAILNRNQCLFEALKTFLNQQ